MDFAAVKDAALLILMFIVFGVPALAIAARLAIRPMLDAIAHLRESWPAHQQVVPDPRIAALEADVNRLRLEVRRLSESEAFIRQLSATPGEDAQS